ncbi:TMEM175 family protein [Haladaptatus salinisoli]|uniref:TMEM175 family protein n=1 Tax=Haladaptatus salinisoli TaxID=2884876 RepID=UPI001D0A492A|nr:TMEM175 family protein [Haladaptatus salinisoli]
MGDSGASERRRLEGLARLAGFSDGVFAIAITLLILNIELPDSTASAAVGVHRVLREWPDFLSYVISFLVIGNYWIVHHNIFQDVRRYDRGLLWLNIVYLMFIAFIPFSTSLIGDFPGGFPVMVYAGTLTLTGVVLTILWRYAWSNDLLDDAVDEERMRDVTFGILIPSAVFAGSVLIAVVSARWAMYSWFLLFFADSIQKRLFG